MICRAMTARLLHSDERRRNETGVVRNSSIFYQNSSYICKGQVQTAVLKEVIGRLLTAVKE